MKTQAAIIEEPKKPFEIKDVELSEPRWHELRVKLASASLCHTDVSAIQGDFGSRISMPIVLGHEGAGIVEAVGEGVTKVKAGDKVLLSVIVHCGNCKNCSAGMTYACENFNAIAFGGGLNDGTRRLSVDGKQLSHFFAQSSFARHAVVPENIAVPLPPDTALEKLSPLSCGVQTGSGAVMNSGMKPGATVAIIGCGGVGLSAVMGAKVVGASEIIAVDTIEERLSLARELGATHTINPKQSDTVEEVKRASAGGVDYAVECVGNAKTIDQAVRSIRPWGTVILVGVPSGSTALAFDFFSLFNATVRGCVAGFANSDIFLPLLVKLNRQGRFPFEKLSPRVYRFEEINEALADMHREAVIKPLLSF